MNKFGGDIWIDTLEVAGMYPAIQGMRNPKNSWDMSDSGRGYDYVNKVQICEIGHADMELAKKLIKAGAEHRKFLRQIRVWADVYMPRYVWQELDTYKFGTKNSQSTMHTLFKRPITLQNFYIGEDPIVMTTNHLELSTIPTLNTLRDLYLKDEDYRWVIEMKRILPESFIQMRTWDTNYEELLNIYHQRKIHRLKEEWQDVICTWIENLPYFKEMCIDE